MPVSVNNLDPVAVAISIFTAFVGPSLAEVIGPYAVVVLSAAIGAGWALERGEHRPWHGTSLFIARICGTAVMATWMVSRLMAAYLPFGLEPVTLMGPIAFAIGAIGDDWQRIGQWLAGHVRERINRHGGGA